MAVLRHFLIVGNRRHGYTLHPSPKVTTLICKSANIEARYPNSEIPNILARLPRIIIERSNETLDEEAQTEVLRFRVTQVEKERIIDNAENAGYTSVSAYLRDVALQRKSESEH